MVWDTNMAAVSLFWDTNMAAMTSCENTHLISFSELQDEEINAEKIISVNPLSTKIDQYQIYACNFSAL